MMKCNKEKPWKQHHHGVDFKDSKQLAICNCGITFTNPYYFAGTDSGSRKPMNNLWNDWGTDEDYFDLDGEQ